MRVLCVGNMYPPHHLGGYELAWRSGVRALRAAGHEARVLTTDHRSPDGTGDDEADVVRELRWYWRDHAFPPRTWRERLGLERHNAAVLDAQLERFRPDVVSWWAMGGMSMALLGRARCVPAVAFVHDDWLVYGPRVDAWSAGWRRIGPLGSRMAALAGAPVGPDVDAVDEWVFVSDFTRRRALEAGWKLAHTSVAHSGIAERFLEPAPAREWGWRLLCAGRVDPRKGIDTALEALRDLPQASLAVVGDGDRDELARLRRIADELGISDRATFAGPCDQEELADHYAQADAVLFPVRWEEPWGLIPLEAMGRARPVVATGTGGSAEYLREGENCLLHAPGDAAGLAGAVGRLAAEPSLRERLVRNGEITASEHTEAAFGEAVVAAVERAGRA